MKLYAQKVFSYKNVQSWKNSCLKKSVDSENNIFAKAMPSDLETDSRVDDSVGQARGNHAIALGANFHRAKLWQSVVQCTCRIH